MAGAEAPVVHALARLDELTKGRPASGDSEGRLIYDVPLRELLAPLVAMPALGFYCSQCHKRISWWALHGGLAMVVFADRRAATKTRTAGTGDLNQARENTGLEPWIDQASRPGGRVQITEWSDRGRSDNNASGYPLRATFSCRCGAKYATKNTTRLRAFLSARRTGSSRILL